MITRIKNSRNVLSSRKFSTQSTLAKTLLHDYHKEVLKAKMVPFAGYAMPVQYQPGILKEHHHCRNSVGLFDVSHMGQVYFRGQKAAQLLEKMTVVDLQDLPVNKGTLSLLMLESGGIKDDCIITKLSPTEFYVVINAACKFTDLKHIDAYKKDYPDVEIEYSEANQLIAVQGPKSQSLLDSIFENADLSQLDFMECTNELKFDGQPIHLTRCGYTGEDGFEVSVPNQVALAFAERLTSETNADGQNIAQWVGLGARDSLRLEAGLCLYGNDIDETTSPIEAMLAWTISKRRRAEGGFLGFETVKDHLENGVARKRCGFLGEKMPIREGKIFNQEGVEIGHVTSGAPSPILQKPIGMAYVQTPFNKFKTELTVKTSKGKELPITVKKMPFVKCNYFKKAE